MRVLTDGLDEELTKLLKNKQVSKVDIATAWATEGDALVALEEHKKRRKGKLTVRTMAGFDGYHTTPGALRRLSKLGEVRLVEGDKGMFHVKVYLFAGSRGSFAWIGSANFTGKGFASNEELLYETRVTAKLQEWFDRRWAKIGVQPDQPERYCENWDAPGVPMRGVTDDREEDGRSSDLDVNDEAEVIVFVQEGPRPPPLVDGGKGKRKPAHGVVRIGGRRLPYRSAQECLPIVMEALQQRDPRFLWRCVGNPRFRKNGESRYIARSQSALGSENFSKYATKMNNGWWLSTKTQTREKWNLIIAAADIAGVEVKVDGEMWQAERRGNVKVGF